MKTREERKAEFAAKKAKISAQWDADKKDANAKLSEGIKRSSEQRAETNEKTQANYAERKEAISEDWGAAKSRFAQRRADRKNR